MADLVNAQYEEAVEAAARSQYAGVAPEQSWDDTDPFTRDLYRKDASAALHAALPHLLAPIEALHEPVDVWEYDDTNGTFVQDADGERVLLARLCRGCSDSEVIGAIEDCEYHADWFAGEVLWPCATAAVLASIKGQPS